MQGAIIIRAQRNSAIAMIKTALEHISEELAFRLGLDISEIHVDSLLKLQNSRDQGLVISLLNVEQESTLKNTPHYIRKNNQLFYKEPPVYLNLLVLLAFEFGNYGKSLQRLSETVEFFQSQRLFDAENERSENPFPPGLNKMILDLQQITMEQLNHIWSIAGGQHFPSLLYKVRLIKIESQDEMKGPEIDTIQLDSGLVEP